MLFRPTPSKLDQARKAARDAASHALESAQGLLDSGQIAAGNVADSLSARANGVAETVAAKANALRKANADSHDDAVDIAAQKAEAARKAAELAALTARRAAEEADKAAQDQLERDARDAAKQRAEFEREQARIEARAHELEQARHAADIRVEEFTFRRDADEETEASSSKLWLLVSAAVFIGAAVAYYFAHERASRSKAVVQDRLAKVKDDAVHKFNEEAASSPAQPEHTAPTSAAPDKLAEVLEIYSTPAEAAIAATVTPAAEIVTPTEAPRIEAYEPLGHIETVSSPVAVDAKAPMEEVPHPNVFDKVAGVVGHVAEAAEHFAGEANVEAHQAEVAPVVAAAEESTTKKKSK